MLGECKSPVRNPPPQRICSKLSVCSLAFNRLRQKTWRASLFAAPSQTTQKLPQRNRKDGMTCSSNRNLAREGQVSWWMRQANSSSPLRISSHTCRSRALTSLLQCLYRKHPSSSSLTHELGSPWSSLCTTLCAPSRRRLFYRLPVEQLMGHVKHSHLRSLWRPTGGMLSQPYTGTVYQPHARLPRQRVMAQL